ncbi:hypothetical protein [Bradyrhizobium sp. USDA 4354]
MPCASITAYVLDSAARHELLGRYSYLTCDPFGTYIVSDGQPSYNGKALDGDPWEALRTLLANYPQERRPDLPPFQAGAAGFLAYDMNRTVEQLPRPVVLVSPCRSPSCISMTR